MKKYQENIKTSYELAEVKLAYKSTVKAVDRFKINSSADSFSYLRTIWDNDNIEHIESVYVLIMNRNNQVLGWCKVSVGGMSGTIMDAKVIFQLALLYNASCIIIAHNHPSGNLKPSNADIGVTKRLREAGKVLDIDVLDHMIMTDEHYYSFADEGMLS